MGTVSRNNSNIGLLSIPVGNPPATPQHIPLIQERIAYLKHFFYDSFNEKYAPNGSI